MFDGPPSPLVKPELVQHLAKLSALALTPEEVAEFTTDLDKIVRYVAELREVDTTGIEAMSLGGKLDNALRPDELAESLSHEAALRAAPQVADGGFVVPTFVEG